MKTLPFSIIIFTMIIFLGLGMESAYADNVSDVYIQDIKVQPSPVQVGETFTVSATFVNNSTFPMAVDGGKCSVEDTQAELFTITLDNHAKNKAENIACAGVGWSPLLDPGKNITATSPDYTTNYVATEPGTAIITVTFSYHAIIQTNPIQTSAEQTVSKSFQFHVHDVNETYAQKPPVYFGLPLEQFKSGTPALDVKCNDGLQLILKAEDASPACVKPDTAQILIERGWAWNYANVVGKESISLSAYHGVSNETFYNNGTVVSDFSIDVNIKNFKPSNAPLVLQVYYNDGILYKTVSVPSGMIQPDGFYGYHLIAVSDENHPVPFKVIATYNNETTMAYAPVFAHP